MKKRDKKSKLSARLSADNCYMDPSKKMDENAPWSLFAVHPRPFFLTKNTRFSSRISKYSKYCGSKKSKMNPFLIKYTKKTAFFLFQKCHIFQNSVCLSVCLCVCVCVSVCHTFQKIEIVLARAQHQKWALLWTFWKPNWKMPLHGVIYLYKKKQF